jgi:hypothetical protein
MLIYIDESGGLGNGGRFFVITCLIPPNTRRLKNLVKSCRLDFGNGQALDELKGFGLTFEQRQRFINKLTSIKDFEYAYLVADKKHIRPELLSRQSICFSYLAGHLLKPIIESAKDDIQIVCDNRNIAVASGNSLQEYLQVKAYSDWGFRHQLSLGFADSRSHNHLQCVDVISNTVYGRYTRNKTHFYRLIEPHKRHSVRFPYQRFGA